MPQQMPNQSQQAPSPQQAPSQGSPPPQENPQAPGQTPGQEGTIPDQSVTQGQDPSQQPQESQTPEKYSAQLLRRLHEDREILLQEYDEMLQHSEHEEINAFVKKKLQSMVKEMDEIEDMFSQHHPDLPPPGGNPQEGVEGGQEGEEPQVPEEEGGEGSVENQDTADSSTPTQEDPEESAEAMRKGTKSLNGWGAYCQRKGMCPQCGGSPCKCSNTKAMVDKTQAERMSARVATYNQGLPEDEHISSHYHRVGDQVVMHPEGIRAEVTGVGRDGMIEIHTEHGRGTRRWHQQLIPVHQYGVRGSQNTHGPGREHMDSRNEGKAISAISTNRGWVASVKGHHDLRGKAFRNQKSAILYAQKMYSDDRWLKHLGFDVYYEKEIRIRPENRRGQTGEVRRTIHTDANDSPAFIAEHGAPGTVVQDSDASMGYEDAVAGAGNMNAAQQQGRTAHGPVTLRNYHLRGQKDFNPSGDSTSETDQQSPDMNGSSTASPSPVGPNSMPMEEKGMPKEQTYELDDRHRKDLREAHELYDELANKTSGIDDTLRQRCFHSGMSLQKIIEGHVGEDTDQLENIDFSEALPGVGANQGSMGVGSNPSQFPGDLPGLEQEGIETKGLAEKDSLSEKGKKPPTPITAQQRRPAPRKGPGTIRSRPGGMQKGMPDKVLASDETLSSPKNVKLHHLKVIHHASQFLMRMANERAFGRKHQNEAYLLYMALMQIVADDPMEDDSMGERGEKAVDMGEYARSWEESEKDREKLREDEGQDERSLRRSSRGTHPDNARLRQGRQDRQDMLEGTKAMTPEERGALENDAQASHSKYNYLVRSGQRDRNATHARQAERLGEDISRNLLDLTLDDMERNEGKSFTEEQQMKSLQETFTRQGDQLASLVKAFSNGVPTEVKE